MKKPELHFEIPELDIKSLVIVREFIQAFLFELDTHYEEELRNYFCSLNRDGEISY